MRSATIGRHVIAVPGRYEASALTDCCERCYERTTPASVLDETHGNRTLGRIATYRCAACGHAWLCRWSADLHRELARCDLCDRPTIDNDLCDRCAPVAAPTERTTYTVSNLKRQFRAVPTAGQTGGI